MVLVHKEGVLMGVETSPATALASADKAEVHRARGEVESAKATEAREADHDGETFVVPNTPPLV